MFETLQQATIQFRKRISPWNFLGPGTRDPSPEFARFTDKIEMKLLPGTKIDAPFIKDYFKGLIEVAGMQAFTDPIILSPDQPNSKMIVAEGYTDPPIPFHSQGLQYVTTPAGEKIPPSSIMAADQPVTHSNVSFYYFPDNGLVTVLVDTCKESNRQQILDYTYDFVKPNTMRDMLTHSKNGGSKWTEYMRSDKKDLHPERKYLPQLKNILGYKDLNNREDVLTRGAVLEQIVLAAKSECNGRLLASLTPDEQKRSQNLYGEYELTLERDHAYGQLDGSIPINQPFIFHDRYMQINRKEAKALNIQPGQTVGMIGAGFNGETAFNVADIAHVHVIAFEKDKERADILRALVEKRGYANKISVIEGQVGRNKDPYLNINHGLSIARRSCTAYADDASEARNLIDSAKQGDGKERHIGILHYKGNLQAACEIVDYHQTKFRETNDFEVFLFVESEEQQLRLLKEIGTQQKLKYKRSISIVVGDPSIHYPSSYSVYDALEQCDGGFIIASLARGKPFIFEDMEHWCKKKGKKLAIVRRVDGDCGLFYKPTNSHLFNTDFYQLDVIGKYTNHDVNAILSFYVVKLGDEWFSLGQAPEEWQDE